MVKQEGSVNMRFCVSNDIFAKFPTACFGVVVVENFQTSAPETVAEMLNSALEVTPSRFPDGIKGHPSIAVWRDAFSNMGLNPNKYLSSVEALTSRVVKTAKLPSINFTVDLVNSLSLKYILPMGAHDIGRIQGDIWLRLSRNGDKFTPFGSDQAEEVPEGEIVYADDQEVRTRRWVWRQGEKAKIQPDSNSIFFPIDGFTDVNRNDVMAARDELAAYLGNTGGKVRVYFVDSANPYAEWSELK